MDSVDDLEARLVERNWPEVSELDLLALFLGPGNSAPVAWRMAAEIYGRLGSLRPLREAVYPELRAAGLGHRRVLAFLAAREIVRRAARRVLPRGWVFHSSQDVCLYFRPLLADLKKECFWVLLLDGKNRLIKLERVSEGCLTRSLVHPREVFRPAIREASAGILFVHNHPSGDPQPSPEDREITRRLAETGKVVGIRVLDHVIIGGYRCFSFADEGLL